MNVLLRLVLKTMYVRGVDTISTLAKETKLTLAVLNDLLDESRERGLTEVLGADGMKLHSEFRYGLTGKAGEWSMEALEQSQYVGPAPVCLEDFYAQVDRQRLLVSASTARPSTRHG